MVHKVKLWSKSCTYQRFYSKFQKKISSLKKRKSRIKSKKLSLRWSALGKIFLRCEFMRIIWFFWRSYQVAKIAFSLETLYEGIFLTEFGGTFFCRLFFWCLFFLGQEENTLGKNPTVKIQVKSGEIPVRKNVKKIM